MKQTTALDILKSGDNVFITGSAGTGKTYLLNQYIEYLKDRKIIPTVVAPTGIAASHLKGQTIHSFFALGIRDSIDESYIESMLDKKYLKIRFSKLKILIIDEISMVSPEIFSSINNILMAFRNTYLPFGGIQVVVSGDFFQLPPISKGYKKKRFSWQSPAWKELDFKTCYLEEKFRQKDNVLIKILDEIRKGKVTDSSHKILHSRQHKELDINFTPTKLYTHNVDVDRINHQELDNLPSNATLYTYVSKGSKKNIEKIFKSSLVLEELALKKDAIVIFIKNNIEKAYINGTTGVVVGFDKHDDMPIVKIATGRRIKLDAEDWSMENDKGTVIATVSQVPLRLAWAITIHKSQGMTLDAAEIDLSKTFEVGQGYVALSRLKSIEGLRLIGLNDMALSVDPLILYIDDYIKKASQKASKEKENITKKNLHTIFNNHIRHLGGITNKLEIKKQKEKMAIAIVSTYGYKTPTYIKTKHLIKKSNTILELAQNRGLSKNTIVGHLITLKKEDSNLNFDKFKPKNSIFNNVKNAVIKLKKRNKKEDFSEDSRLRLKPIFDALEGKIGYDDIKICLLFLGD